jgi:hypothetical protein
VKVRLELDGETLELPTANEEMVEIPAGGERRVDWRVKVAHEGQAVVRMLALTDEESDAVEMKFPVYLHGLLKTESFTGVLRPEDRLGTFEITVPGERRADQTRLEVRYSPTLAGAMVDALPYLVDYPYGCTEQTLNRFLPAVITQRTLLHMQLDLKAIRDKRTNLNAQEIGDPDARAKGWQRYDRNPVFDDVELSKIVKAGVNRLAEMALRLPAKTTSLFRPAPSNAALNGSRITARSSCVILRTSTTKATSSTKPSQPSTTPITLTRSCIWCSSTPARQTTPCANISTMIAPSSPFTA